MFIVPVYAGPSKIAGLGLFATRDIQAGEKVWEFHPKIDIQFTPDEWAALPAHVLANLEEHAWQSYPNGVIYFEATAGKYINHAAPSNTDFTVEGVGYARVDIPVGTEITSDYREFMADWSHLPFVPPAHA